jgi:hypothetical protein
MTQYTITLTLTYPPPANPSRRAKAFAAAHRHQVHVLNVIDNGATVVWVVKGEEDDVCKMIYDWTHPPNHPTTSNVQVTYITPPLNCSPPSIAS